VAGVGLGEESVNIALPGQSREERDLMPRWFVLGLGLVFMYGAAWSAQPPTGPVADRLPGSAIERLLATMQEAVDLAPQSRVRLADLESTTEELKVDAASSAPAIAWQREGIGSSFNRQPNSIDYLKLAKTYSYPWQKSAGNRVVEESDRWESVEAISIVYSEAQAAGSDWLSLAAATEDLAIAKRRLEQLNRALAIQNQRFELGEVSGSEVTQLRLARLGESARLREQEVQARLIQARLRARVVSDELDPVLGDLESLVRLDVAGLPMEEGLDSLVESSPAVQAARLRANLEEANSRLARRISWGRPAAEVEWERVPDIGEIEGFSAIGFHLAFPLPFGKAAQRTAAAAEARAASATQQLELIHREVTSWLHNELATGLGAEETLEELVPELVGLPRARESLSQQFALGAVSYLVYLDGLARLDEVELQGVEARRALLEARLSMALLLEHDSFFPIPTFNVEVEP